MSNSPDRIARCPEPQFIAGYVRLSRRQWGWKQSTLAIKAEVSLSTVQRVERGDPVSPENLDRIANALELPAGAFTTPRVELPEDEALASLHSSMSQWAQRQPVSVAPFRTEKQLRALARTDLAVVDSELGEQTQQDLDDLREWIDLAGFMLLRVEGGFLPKAERSFRARELYADIFEQVAETERRLRAVCLVGTYAVETDNVRIPSMSVALIALRSKDRNPAAIKLSTLWTDKRVAFHDLVRAEP